MAGLRDELQAIYDRRGQLTPADVVDEARDESHPLHNRFEWDDSVAGRKWRETQAQELIRSVRITYRDSAGAEKDVRAFHAIRKPTGHVYEPAERIAEDPMLTKILLADMEREWRQFRRRYEHFAEFAEMIRRDLDAA